MSVTDIMLAAASPNPSIRGPAEQMIFDARASDLPNFLVALVQELRNSDKPIESRQMAGLVLKNSVAFAAREVELKKQLEDIWRGVPAETRSYVKEELMAALESNEAIVRRTVALAIANLARIELPANEWPTLIETLCGAVASESVEWMEAGLTTLGYVCEECIGNGPLTATLAQYAEQILGAIFQGLYFENPTVKYNAINALCNAIDFIGAQMKDPTKSGALFEAICATASSSDSETSAKALETLVVVARLYYETLGDHMNALWAVTMAAIQQENDESPALQGIQFWIAIAEVEAEMMKEGEPHQAYVTNWLTDLFQMVVWALQKQDPNQTEDDWNVSNAASKLLVAMAEAAGDNIVPVAMEFVSANLQSENWRLREASVLVFGAILHGPTPGSLEQTVAETVETICGYLSDKVPLVVDTAGWALSLIAAEYSSVLLSPTFLGPVLGAVMPLFNYHHLLVTRAAAIIHNLCLYFDDDDDDDEGEAQTNELSSCYSDICQALLSALDRPDLPDQCKHDVQEALNRLFGAAAPDSFNVLYDLVPQMLHRLHAASEATKNGGGPELEITQGLIVGSLNHIARRIKPNMVPLLPDVVNGLTHMFDCARDGSVLAEGIMCIGALALAARRDFVPWLETIHTFVQAAITSIDDYDLCITGISTIGDIAAGCEGGIEPMLPETMSNFFAALSNPELDDDLLGPIISCLGDIALNAAPQFQPYLDQAVQAVATVDAESRTEQLQEGHNANTDETIGGLWENILSFGTGIVQGFAENLEPVLPHLPYLLDFVLHAAMHMQDDADIIKGCVTLLGDMANAIRHGPPEYHASARDSLCVNAVQQILSNALDFDDELVTGAAEWAGKELRHLSNC